jgi:hypothetical protein
MDSKAELSTDVLKLSHKNVRTLTERSKPLLIPEEFSDGSILNF